MAQSMAQNMAQNMAQSTPQKIPEDKPFPHHKIGDKVLCYEPDPVKQPVIYRSVIMVGFASYFKKNQGSLYSFYALRCKRCILVNSKYTISLRLLRKYSVTVMVLCNNQWILLSNIISIIFMSSR